MWMRQVSQRKAKAELVVIAVVGLIAILFAAGLITLVLVMGRSAVDNSPDPVSDPSEFNLAK